MDLPGFFSTDLSWGNFPPRNGEPGDLEGPPGDGLDRDEPDGAGGLATGLGELGGFAPQPMGGGGGTLAGAFDG